MDLGRSPGELHGLNAGWPGTLGLFHSVSLLSSAAFLTGAALTASAHFFNSYFF